MACPTGRPKENGLKPPNPGQPTPLAPSSDRSSSTSCWEESVSIAHRRSTFPSFSLSTRARACSKHLRLKRRVDAIFRRKTALC